MFANICIDATPRSFLSIEKVSLFTGYCFFPVELSCILITPSLILEKMLQNESPRNNPRFPPISEMKELNP